MEGETMVKSKTLGLQMSEPTVVMRPLLRQIEDIETWFPLQWQQEASLGLEFERKILISVFFRDKGVLLRVPHRSAFLGISLDILLLLTPFFTAEHCGDNHTPLYM